MINLNIINWNCKGISSKVYEFDELVRSNKIDIILFSERLVSAQRPQLNFQTTILTDKIVHADLDSLPQEALQFWLKKNIIHQRKNIQTTMDDHRETR